MSELVWPVEVIDDGSGIELQACLAGCRCSNIDPEHDEGIPQDTFHVFWEPRFNPPHLHIQCFDCEQTYCPFQLCVPPPTADIYTGE
jgi:hypothetical protein